MTNVTTPIEATFEMQRQSIKQTQQLFEQGLELQRNALGTFRQNDISAQRSAQQQGAEFLQQLVNAQLDAVKSSVNGDEVRSALNSQFYDFEAAQDEAWDEFESGFVEAFDELSRQQKHVIAQSVEAFLDAQQDAERQTEQAVQADEETTEVAVEGAEEAEQQAEVQVADAAADATVEAEKDDGADNEAAEELEAIEGLGATYADRLRSRGIESITHLAQANSETVADTAGIPKGRAEEWITSAQSQA